MQPGGISSQDQWTRFMQLSNAARLRNQGLETAARGVERPVKTRSPQPLQGSGVPSLPSRPGAMVSGSYAPVQRATPVRILGGAFDAYA